VAAELIWRLDLPTDAAIIDVGGGASTLVDILLGAGYEDVSVLDVSSAALEAAQHRLGEASQRVTWLRRDLLQWEPDRPYDLWHDRAVFHFLVGSAERDLYRRALRNALRRDGHAIVATFALNGPTHCSGLEVRRYSPEGICQELGAEFSLVAARAESHTTPGGMTQPFSWAMVRRRPDAGSTSG
jgi:trans-aconitate methyltransferase